MILSTLAAAALATVPLPPYPDCAPDKPELCPSDLDDWEHLSSVPEGSVDSVRPEELAAGAGLGLDVALHTTSGRWDVTIAVLDSGIEWDSTNLVNKVWLNTDELPVPQDAGGADAPTHDLNGDGVVNVLDYANDPRVDITAGTDAADHMLDASDLIATFSDGVDDDGNGFTDDIAGWDFFAGDNNPYADLRTQYGGHGTGIMKGAAAEGDDGGDLGTCPNCSILPLRTGDAFITDGDRLGRAIAYATDRGALVIANAGAGLTHPAWIRDALAHAEAHGVVMVAAAGDENAWHRNLPAAEDPILYVHAVRAAEADADSPGVFSFLNHGNCNNYGPRVDVVAPSEDCASGSTQLIAGSVGLLRSASLDMGLDLSAAELRALVRSTAFDIDLSESDRETANAYPSGPGWDPVYGHGRVDLGAAMDALAAGDVPPVAELTAPRWFSWPGDHVIVEGAVAADRAASVSWTLELAQGVWPDAWEEVASGQGPADGVLAELDLSGYIAFDELIDEDVMQRFARAHEGMRTLRLTATDDAGRITTIHRSFWQQDDPDLLPGFPLELSGSLEGSPALVDLDGDNVFEIVQTSGDGRLHVLRGDGTELDGFPVRTDALPMPSAAFGDDPPHEGVLTSPAVGDVDGDGVVDLVMGSVAGKVYAFDATGAALPGFPVAIAGRALDEIGPETAWDPAILATPALGDVDGDGALELIVAGSDQKLYVWGGDGALWPGYPLDLCVNCATGARIVSSPAIGDLDADGDLDLVVGTNEVPVGDAGMIFAVDLAAAALWDGYPITRDGLINQEILPVVGVGHPSSVAIADLDGDGDLELAAPALLSTPDLLHHDGTVALEPGFAADAYGADATFLDGSFLSLVTNPAFGDLDMDGRPDLALGGASVLYLLSLPIAEWAEFQHAIGAWSSATGEAFSGFPRQVDDVAFLAAPAIADLSGDGFVEVVSGTRDGWLFAWRTAGHANQAVQWSGMRHDPTNSGNSQVPLAPQLGPGPGAASGCCKAGGDTAAAWLLAPLGLLALRRRRQRAGMANGPRFTGV